MLLVFSDKKNAKTVMKYNVSTLNFGNYLGVFKERDIQNIRQEINKTTQKCDQH